ncbi:MAG: condensation domain-containing protein, partial [Burkholderiales bacterium]
YEPNTSLYNMPLALKLEGELDVQALRSALSEIVRRHETLRTTFNINGGEPLQIIHPASEIELPICDLGGLAPDERHAEFVKLKRAAAQRPFDLAAGPLIRAMLVRLADSEHALFVTLHHIVCDAWSMGIFRLELDPLYRDYASGLRPQPPELPIQYADYAVWQRQWLQGEVLDKQTAYWEKQLAALPPLLELPTDRPRPALQTFRGAHCSLTLPQSLCAALHALSRREQATLYMTLLAVFQVLLARYARSDDIAVGSPIAGRTRAETENLIGFFVNTLVLRTDLSGNPSFRELLKRVREVCLSAYAHQDVPFEKLVEELKPARSLSYSPLVQVLFSLQNVAIGGLKLPGLKIRRLTASRETAKFDLTLNAYEDMHGLKVVAEFNTDLFNAATIARLLGHYEVLLA